MIRSRQVVLAVVALAVLATSGCVYRPDAVGPLREFTSWAEALDGVDRVTDQDAVLTNAANPFSDDSVGTARVVLDDDSDAQDVDRVARAVWSWIDDRPDDRFDVSVDGPTGGLVVPDEPGQLDESLALVAQAAADPDVVGVDVDLGGISTVVVRRGPEARVSTVWDAWAPTVPAGGTLTVVAPAGGVEASAEGLARARASSSSDQVAGTRSVSGPAVKDTVGGIAPVLPWLDGLEAVDGVEGWAVTPWSTDDQAAVDPDAAVVPGAVSATIGVAGLSDVDPVDDIVRAVPGAESVGDLRLAYDDVEIRTAGGPGSPGRSLFDALVGEVAWSHVAVGPSSVTASSDDPSLPVRLQEAVAGSPGAGSVTLGLSLTARDAKGTPRGGGVDVQDAPASRVVDVLPGLRGLLDDPRAGLTYVRDDGALDVSVDDRFDETGLAALVAATADAADGTAVSYRFAGRDGDETSERFFVSFVSAARLTTADVDASGGRDEDPDRSRARTQALVDAWNAR
ncbi:hypothetical protein [Frigoribacterium sp. MCBA15_019]|uniref:hypothetical protein n=1 Tax=Frigoribacterium sp. MCBA15_019 TaxID=1898745 RepID=UPI0008DCEE48|nr:hypothetical protein [Frigoribacterium sp. MCBA15_019]OII23789.1 hypothetical protein BIV04_06840 [Frigoribacterium sp. MCBA15_019]